MPRELIDTGTDKRYVRRDQQGHFRESDDVGRSSAQDQQRDFEHHAEARGTAIGAIGMNGWPRYVRQALRSPIVIFALASALIAAVGAPLFALSDVIN